MSPSSCKLRIYVFDWQLRVQIQVRNLQDSRGTGTRVKLKMSAYVTGHISLGLLGIFCASFVMFVWAFRRGKEVDEEDEDDAGSDDDSNYCECRQPRCRGACQNRRPWKNAGDSARATSRGVRDTDGRRSSHHKSCAGETRPAEEDSRRVQSSSWTQSATALPSTLSRSQSATLPSTFSRHANVEAVEHPVASTKKTSAKGRKELANQGGKLEDQFDKKWHMLPEKATMAPPWMPSPLTRRSGSTSARSSATLASSTLPPRHERSLSSSLKSDLSKNSPCGGCQCACISSPFLMTPVSESGRRAAPAKVAVSLSSGSLFYGNVVKQTVLRQKREMMRDRPCE